MIDINKMRVASPCSVGWETMSGDERSRHCESCKLSVYNIAGMTNAEVQHLVTNREGRLCIRLFRRPDGTVITKDCPIGLRAFQKRIAKFAGATLSVLFSLVSWGSAQSDKTGPQKENEKIERKTSDTGLTGTVVDAHGAVIPDATVKVFAKDGKKPLVSTRSSADGSYGFSIVAGTYRLEVRRKHFKTSVIQSVIVMERKLSKVDVHLELAGESVVVGIIAEDSLIDMSSSSVTTKITRRQIDGLPY